MDNQYPPHMPPMGAYYNPGPPNPMLPQAPEFYHQSRLHHLQTMSNESLGGYSGEYEDYNRPMLPGQGPSRSRRRATGSEHIKHRRTRSGCYTCRQRRVKCDENHPICDRCIKGKRECHYPDNSTASRSAKSKSKGSQDDMSASPSGDELDINAEPLSSIPDEDEDAEGEEQSDTVSGSDTQRTAPKMPHRQSQSAPTSAVEGSATLPQGSMRPQMPRTNSKQNVKTSITQSGRWASLPKDVKFYLKFHRDRMSYHHFAFKYDGTDFLKTTYLDIALNDEALLYAVVSFSAYHYTLTQEHGKMSHFLKYYNTSLKLLRESLCKSKRHTLSRLLTILQLATIEEFLGDWVNLIGHQKAAHQIITELYTPQNIMQSETHRQIISWYIRFDLFAGMMSGGETVLGREWFAACEEFYQRQSRERPQEVGPKIQQWFATTRLLATDVALLFANKAKGGMDDEQFAEELRSIDGQFDRLGHTLKTTYTHPSCFVKEFPNAPPPNPDDITDFRDPNFLYREDMFAQNYVLIDFWAIHMMFKFQCLSVQRLPPTPELTTIALNQCKMFDAVQYSDQGPEGKILGCQASLGIASLFLPKDKKHTDWMRSKFALIEQNGYIYPAALRKRMTDIWAVDVTSWWLPNNEGYPPVLRAVRDFIEFREQLPADSVSNDVREMNGIFKGLDLSAQDVPAHLKDHIDPDTFNTAIDPNMLYESSPDQAYADQTWS